MNPAAKKLFEYGLVGLVIAFALVAGLQVRPRNVFPSNGSVELRIASDPSTITCVSHINVNVTSLVVTISSFSIRRTGDFNLTGDWINMTSFPKTVDLVKIANTGDLPLGSMNLPEGELNLVRLEVSSAVATTTSNPQPTDVAVSGGHLQAQISTHVEIGKTTSVLVRVVQPHIICQGKDKLRITPELSASSEGPD